MLVCSSLKKLKNKKSTLKQKKLRVKVNINTNNIEEEKKGE